MESRIVHPTGGEVTLTLTWEEAEVLTRLAGMANTGNLRTFAPGLLKFVGSMVAIFGRNTNDEAERYMATVRGSQVYIDDRRELQ